MFRLKDIVVIGLLTTLLFPVVVFAVLLSSGVLQFYLGEDKRQVRKLNDYIESTSPEQKQQDAAQLESYQANLKLKEDIGQQRDSLAAETERLENLKLELSRMRDEIDGARKRIEKLTDENRELSNTRLEELAQTYGAMKPVDAASILLQHKDQEIAGIIKRVPEQRAKAKIMAALGAMDTGRAANISKILGWKNNQGG